MLDLEAARQALAGLGFDRVVDGIVVGRGQLLLNLVEELHELVDRIEARKHLWTGGALDEKAQVFSSAIQHGRDLQALALAHAVGQLDERSGGRLSREHVVSNGAQRDHVQGHAAGAGVGKALGGQVAGSVGLDQLAKVGCGSAARRG